MIYVCVGKFLHMASLGAVKEMEHFGSFGFLLPAVAQYYYSFKCQELRNYKGRHSTSYCWSCLYDQYSTVGT